MAKTALLYSLPHDCPIPWPAHPSYAIVNAGKPRLELDQAYLEALYPPLEADLSSTLLSFARLLLSLASDRPRDPLEAKIRSIILPLHDFDQKWRVTVPALVRPTSTDNELDAPRPTLPSKKDKLGDQEKVWLLESHRKWRKEEEEKLELDRPKSQPIEVPPVEASETAMEGSSTSGDSKLGSVHTEGKEEIVHKPRAWTMKDVNIMDWVTACELLDTRLHCLLLLALVSLPASLASPPLKPKKKKDPERYASTLDPELLLDFLTDRLQIWRVMKDVNDLGLGTESQGADKKKEGTEEDERDEVQQWWLDVVEALFTSHAPAELLSHHRAKLFPSATPTDALAQRLAPAPSPFKTRSLLSLDKSARRKERGQRPLVAESPTMKRLLGGGGSMGGASDVFKVPSVPSLKRKASEVHHATASLTTSSLTTAETSGAFPKGATGSTRAPRKQERPRPLPRGDSLIGSSKGLFNRREVSFGKRSTGLGVKKKHASTGKTEATVERSQTSKRKSVSPKKSHSAANAASFTLVPDTPAASRTSSIPLAVQAPGLPSFAALGAAFRPGASAVPDFLPASLSASSGMDWDDDDEDEMYLRAFERDHGKGGAGRRMMDVMGTPEQPARRGRCVPDT